MLEEINVSSDKSFPLASRDWIYKWKTARPYIKLAHWGTSLAVKRLGLCRSTAGGMGSTPGQGTKILHAKRHGQKKKKKLERWPNLQQPAQEKNPLPTVASPGSQPTIYKSDLQEDKEIPICTPNWSHRTPASSPLAPTASIRAPWGSSSHHEAVLLPCLPLSLCWAQGMAVDSWAKATSEWRALACSHLVGLHLLPQLLLEMDGCRISRRDRQGHLSVPREEADTFLSTHPKPVSANSRIGIRMGRVTGHLKFPKWPCFRGAFLLLVSPLSSDLPPSGPHFWESLRCRACLGVDP